MGREPPPDSKRGRAQRGGLTYRESIELEMLSIAGVWGKGDTLAGLAMLSSALDALTTSEIARRRDEDDSWALIGQSLGVTRQAAHLRYGPAVKGA